jgi:hypothetical protein
LATEPWQAVALRDDNRSLSRLELSANSLDAAAGRGLAAALRQNGALAHLGLAASGIDEALRLELEQLCLRNRQRQRGGLDGSPLVRTSSGLPIPETPLPKVVPGLLFSLASPGLGLWALGLSPSAGNNPGLPEQQLMPELVPESIAEARTGTELATARVDLQEDQDEDDWAVLDQMSARWEAVVARERGAAEAAEQAAVTMAKAEALIGRSREVEAGTAGREAAAAALHYEMEAMQEEVGARLAATVKHEELAVVRERLQRELEAALEVEQVALVVGQRRLSEREAQAGTLLKQALETEVELAQLLRETADRRVHRERVLAEAGEWAAEAKATSARAAVEMSMVEGKAAELRAWEAELTACHDHQAVATEKLVAARAVVAGTGERLVALERTLLRREAKVAARARSLQADADAALAAREAALQAGSAEAEAEATRLADARATVKASMQAVRHTAQALADRLTRGFQRKRVFTQRPLKIGACA